MPYRPLAYVLLALLAGPTQASAHAILMDSTPAPRGTLSAGPVEIRLHFNSRIDPARSRLTLRGANQDQVLTASAAAPDTLAAQITLPPGEFTLRWQVLAIDGHLTRGDVPFTVGPRDGVYSAKRP